MKVRNIWKWIRTIAGMGIMLTAAYWIGRMQMDHADCKAAAMGSHSEDSLDIIDMRDVVDYRVTEYGLQLYLNDGTGYYWER